MILVSGATGTIGSLLVDALLARGARVGAMSRTPSKITVRDGVTPLDGVTKADAFFLLQPAGPDLPERERALLDAAVAAGIPRVVKLSAIGTTEEGEPGSLSAWHAMSERAVRGSGTEWTILRPTTFSSNTLSWAADLKAGRPVPNMTGDGRQGVVDPADVAEVAAVALLEKGHGGRVYTLTGPEAIDVPRQAAQLAEVLGRPVPVRDVPPQEAAGFVPPEFSEALLAGLRLVRAGGNTTVTADVREVLGRDAGTYRAWAIRHRDRF